MGPNDFLGGSNKVPAPDFPRLQAPGNLGTLWETLDFPRVPRRDSRHPLIPPLLGVHRVPSFFVLCETQVSSSPPQVEVLNKQGQTGHKLQIATFWDPYNYLSPPGLIWDPRTIWDSWNLFGTPWTI